MSNNRHIFVRDADTEPLDIVISASGVSDLDNLTEAKLYLRERDASSNYVDGATLTVKSSSGMILSFDPVGAKVGGGNALADGAAIYEGHVLCTWSDGDETRHPNYPDLLVIRVLPRYDS